MLAFIALLIIACVGCVIYEGNRTVKKMDEWENKIWGENK